MIMKGQKINDRYQIIKSIGEGGMANVYLAYDTILDRDVAVKVLRGDLADDEKFVRRFQREALNASSLSHPNIVEVYDVGDDNGQYYIVMEYIDGKDLKSLLKKRGKLTVPEVVDIMTQIADGLSVAHDSYIIHRDIKPQNIMILENGLVKITDFGIAMAMNATQLTQTNSVMGSVHYLPPEQASGKGSTLKSDIYSMGILMYELLTGVLPFRGDNAVEIALKHLKEPFPNIREELPDIPQAVENIVLKSAAKNPKNRYNDARAMYEDLKTCLDESRKDEERIEYQYPELDSDGKKFTKGIENAKNAIDKEDEEEKVLKKKDKKKNKEEIDTEVESDEKEEVEVKQISNDEVKKENRILIVLSAIFVSLLLIVAVVCLFLKSELLGNKTVAVPDVSGMSEQEAVKTLQDAGFVIADENKTAGSDTVAEGDIVKTAPVAGTKKSKGTTITLYVSLGSVTYEVEDFTGQNRKDVEAFFKALKNTDSININLIVITKEVEDGMDYEEDIIIEQDVEPGTKLKDGDYLTVYVPDVVSTFPDFTDGTWTVEQVQEFCEEYEVTLSIEYTTEYDVGKIGKQSRKEGYKINRGSSALTIYVGEEATEECSDLDGSCEESSTDTELDS